MCGRLVVWTGAHDHNARQFSMVHVTIWYVRNELQMPNTESSHTIYDDDDADDEDGGTKKTSNEKLSLNFIYVFHSQCSAAFRVGYHLTEAFFFAVVILVFVSWSLWPPTKEDVAPSTSSL